MICKIYICNISYNDMSSLLSHFDQNYLNAFLAPRLYSSTLLTRLFVTFMLDVFSFQQTSFFFVILVDNVMSVFFSIIYIIPHLNDTLGACCFSVLLAAPLLT